MFDWITEPVGNAFAGMLDGIRDMLACIIPGLLAGIMWMIDWLLANLYVILPSTPQGWTLNAIYNGLGQAVPILNGAELAEIISGIIGMVTLLLVYKLIKLIPFIG